MNKKLKKISCLMLVLVLLLSACANITEKSLLEKQEKSDAELSEFFFDSENMYLLDLTLPLLEEGFVDAETAAIARSAETSLERYVLKTEGKKAWEKFLTLAPDSEELVEYKNAWLDYIEASEDYTPYALICYERNTKDDANEYPFVIFGEEVNWYFASQDVRDMGYPSFISYYLEIAELAPLDFADAREALKGHIPDEHPAVDVYTCFSDRLNTGGINGADAAGRYFPREQCIRLYYNWGATGGCLLHEYIHFLRRDTAGADPLSREGITEAIAVLECKNRMSRLLLKTATDEEINELAVLGYLDDDNININLKKATMVVAAGMYLGLYTDPCYSISQSTMTRPKTISKEFLSYEESACIIWYMFSLYGKDTTIEHIENSTIHKLIQKPFERFYEDFGEWLVSHDVIQTLINLKE